MEKDYTAHQKAGLAFFWLLQGNQLTVAEMARLTGLTWHGANYMLEMMSGVLPIYCDRSKWQVDRERLKTMMRDVLG